MTDHYSKVLNGKWTAFTLSMATKELYILPHIHPFIHSFIHQRCWNL